MNPITEYALQNLMIDKVLSSNYFIEKSKDNKNIIKIIKNSKPYYIGSNYSVTRDIINFINQMGDYNVNTIFVVFGLAAGEHIVDLLHNISDSNKILIIEPDENIIKLFLNTKQYIDNIANNDRVVITSCDERMLDIIINKYIEDFAINNIKFLIFANYDRLYKEKYQLSYSAIKNYIEVKAMNIVTNQRFSKDFFKCFVKNIKNIIKSTPINETKNSLIGIPAVVVSAGPSLEKNIEQLKRVQDKFLIISGGRTISALNKVNVYPHLVSVIDPGEASYEVIKNSLGCDAPLLFCEVTNHKVVEEYSGDKIFTQEGYILDEVTKEILETKVDALYQGGSVAHTCAAFAQYLGCNPIIFIGQDFAFTNNKLHADIASIEINNINDKETIMVEGVDEDQVPTSKLFDIYRKNMEQFIENHTDTIFINSSEGGANIKGTKVIKLQEAIEIYGKRNLDKDMLSIIRNKSNSFNEELIKVNIETILKDLEKLRNKCSVTVEYSKEVLEYYENSKKKNINLLLSKIKEINSNIGKVKFISNLLQPIIFQVLMNPEYMEKINETEKERGTRFAKQAIKLYSEIIISIDEAVPYVKECIKELSKTEV